MATAGVAASILVLALAVLAVVLAAWALSGLVGPGGGFLG